MSSTLRWATSSAETCLIHSPVVGVVAVIAPPMSRPQITAPEMLVTGMTSVTLFAFA